MFKICENCGEETLFISETVYDGFKKVGETRRCSACGHLLEETKASKAPASSTAAADPLAALFGDDAKPEKIELFDVEAETRRLCRKCVHYVIHPFTQRCGLHDREVSATDSCPQFSAKNKSPGAPESV